MSINLVKSMSLISIAGICLPAVAVGDHSLKPYVGVDIGIKKIGFKSGYGDTLFKNQPVGSVFAGIELCPHFEVSVTLEKTILSRKKKSSLNDGGRELGMTFITNAPNGSYGFDSKAQFSSIGVDLFYKFNIGKYEKFKPLIGIGIKRVKVKLANYVTDSTRPGWSTNFNLVNNKYKVAVKLAGGAEYMFTNNLGGRVLLHFENTSGLSPSDNKGRVANLKNSFGATIGAIVRI